jgi:ribonuclease HI
MVKIYTDGSCLGNPGPGGWAWHRIDGEYELSMCGGDPSTTNNRMEMMAVIEALVSLKGNECTIYTDSKLVMNCAQRLWKRKANTDLWEQYDKASKSKTLKWVWVRGHSGDKYNEIVDKLANNEAKNIKKVIS